MLWSKVAGAGGVAGGAGGIISYSVGGNAFEIGSSVNFSATFSSMSIGDEPSAGQKRYIVVCDGGCSFYTDDDISTTSMTVGGITTTLAQENLSSSTSFKQYVGVRYAEVPTGTTATVIVNSAKERGFGVQLYVVYVSSGEALALSDSGTDGGSTTLTATVDAPLGNSLAVTCAQFRNGEATPSISFSGTLGVTTDYRADLLSDENFYAGSIEKTSSATGLTSVITDAGAAGAESVSIACVFTST